jgi:hypothetical protein
MFAGLPVDPPGARNPRFPAHLEPLVARDVARELAVLRPAAGFGTACSAGDLLISEALIACQAPLHLFVPFQERGFRGECVRPGSRSWLARYQEVRRHVRTFTRTRAAVDEGESPLAACRDAVEFFASSKARDAALPLRLLVVWDGQGAGAANGATDVADVVRQWHSLDRLHVVRVDLLAREAEQAAGR